MKIELVEQEDEHGCVVACLAMVTGRSYADVRKDFLNDFSKQGVEMDVTEEYLRDCGFSIIHKEFTGMAHRETVKPEMLKPFAPAHIARFLQFTDAEHGHMVVMTDKGKLICPQKSDEQTLKDCYAITDVFGLYK